MPDMDLPRANVADRLAAAAAERPGDLAVVAYDGGRHYDAEVLRQKNPQSGFVAYDAACGVDYTVVTFGYLNHQANLLARGLMAMGVGPGARIALLVKPGVEFVTLVFALLRSGATMVLVDAGLGRKNLVRCLASTEPDGFVAIPLGHAMRVLKRRQFPKAKLNVTVGRRWFWGGETLGSLRELGRGATPTTGVGDSPLDDSAIRTPHSELPATRASDPAAIVFTSGSTGPPKGVLYTHETFVTQCDEIQRQYDIQPGAVDLACFPLFGLFNVACGVTTVLPDMDYSRPASCDPKKVLAAANQWKVTQAFASPAVWDRLSTHCERTGESIPTLKKVLSCGAPVPAKVLRRTLECVHPDAEMHTPYGATEALPVATIEAQEILKETAAKTNKGAGVCVGRPFGPNAESGNRNAESFGWRVIKIRDEPIATIEETEEMPTGEIGELIVRGPQVSKRYLIQEPTTSVVGAPDHNASSKIKDGQTVWHRMGDVGYFDEEGRFWYCGRKSQRVVTEKGILYTECVEAVYNDRLNASQSALVGISRQGRRRAVVVYDLRDNHCTYLFPWEQDADIAHEPHEILDKVDADICYRGPLPTDIRHNSKIRREELAAWANKKLTKFL